MYDLFMRYVVASRQPSQQDMNALWSGADWNIAERYTDIMKTLGVGLFYAAAVPYGLLVTAAALLTSFFVDHYCLLRLWAWKPDFDDQISRRAIGCIALLVFVHVLVAQYFFQNWGVYPTAAIENSCFNFTNTEYRKEALRAGDCDATTISAGHCLSKFLVCAPSNAEDKPWERTSAQKLARRAYPIIGGFALAIAIWRLVGIVFKRCLKEFIWGTHSHDYDKQMPVGFRDLGDEMAISAYAADGPAPRARRTAADRGQHHGAAGRLPAAAAGQAQGVLHHLQQRIHGRVAVRASGTSRPRTCSPTSRGS